MARPSGSRELQRFSASCSKRPWVPGFCNYCRSGRFESDQYFRVLAIREGFELVACCFQSSEGDYSNAPNGCAETCHPTIRAAVLTWRPTNRSSRRQNRYAVSARLSFGVRRLSDIDVDREAREKLVAKDQLGGSSATSRSRTSSWPATSPWFARIHTKHPTNVSSAWLGTLKACGMTPACYSSRAATPPPWPFWSPLRQAQWVRRSSEFICWSGGSVLY
jgi:hypothetical protein